MSVLFIIYAIVISLVCLKIIYDTDTPSKAMAYLVLVVIFPVFGIIFYFSIGVNYRKRKLYRRKLDTNQEVFHEVERKVETVSRDVLETSRDKMGQFFQLAKMNSRENTLTTQNNSVCLYINGEEKFPDVMQSIANAKHHVHIEYYIYENDDIGGALGDLLIEKAQEGVEVRFIYDDFGSKTLKSKFLRKLKEGGVQVSPFYKIQLLFLANSLNYRNHRKIIVVDGLIGYIGGINVSDRYINQGKEKLYWRDTHLRIEGPAVMNLQYTFLTDWNFCAKKSVGLTEEYFPLRKFLRTTFGNQTVQIIASGPDSDYASIMYSLINAIALSRKEVFLTTPYFIPEKSFLDVLKIAKLSDVDVKVLVPGKSDSFFVNATSNSNYLELLNIGIEIYRYKRGFVHAKTMVCDSYISVVGTANLDQRSFDLNFEVNAIVYGESLAKELRSNFLKDLEDSEKIILAQWKERPFYITFFERIMRLFSSLM